MVLGISVGLVYRRGKAIEVGAVPWVGNWGFDVALIPRLVVAAAACAAAVRWLPPLVVRSSTRRVVVAAVATTMVLTTLLAWAGPDNTHWVSLRFGYGAHTRLVDDWGGPAEFLAVYVERMPGLTAHLRAHPPGLVMALWALEAIGLSGRTFDLLLMVGAGGLCTAAALAACRAVAGLGAMRAAAPFVAIGPVLVWRTNPDVIFAAISVSAVALIAYAFATDGARSDWLAIGGGVVFAVALFFSYGLMLLALPVFALALQYRRWRPLLIAAIVSAVGLLAPLLWGFWWLAGLLETRVQYRESIAHVRGYKYWLLGNAVIYAALLGPAVFVAIRQVRSTRLAALVYGSVACAVAAGLSGLSSAETERIWQPFVPLVLLAGAALWWSHSNGRDQFDVATARRWLSLQVVVALFFQSFLWTRV